MLQVAAAVLASLSLFTPPGSAGPEAAVAALKAPDATPFSGAMLFQGSKPSDPALVSELIRVIRADPEFGPGTPARERAMLALASTVNAAGFYSFEHEGQADLLVEGISEQSGPVQREIIARAHFLPVAAKPAAVESLSRILTGSDDPIFVIEAVLALGRMGDLAAAAAEPIRRLLLDPSKARPELWQAVLHLEAEWPGPSFSSQLRLAAADARIRLGTLRDDLDDLYPKLDAQGRTAAAKAIVGRLIETSGGLATDDAVAIDALRFVQEVFAGQDPANRLQDGGMMALLLVVEKPEVPDAVKRQAVDTFLGLRPAAVPDGQWLRKQLRDLGYLPGLK